MVTALRFSQPSNALAGIVVTVAGIVTRTARVLPANTPASNAVTGLLPKVPGIVRVVFSNDTALTVADTLLVEYVHSLPSPSVHFSAYALDGVSIEAPTTSATANLMIIRLMCICIFPFLCRGRPPQAANLTRLSRKTQPSWLMKVVYHIPSCACKPKVRGCCIPPPSLIYSSPKETQSVYSRRRT